MPVYSNWYKEKLFKGGGAFFTREVKNAAFRAVDRMTEFVKEAAIEDLQAKRNRDRNYKTRDESPLCQSFHYSVLGGSGTKVVGQVVAEAPYAGYVNDGWVKPNASFEGYHFMETSVEKLEENADNIIDEEFMNALV